MKLGKQLGSIRRELVAHPKKAVALAVLLAAAAWFWGPILWRKIGGRPAAAEATSAVAASAPIVPAGGQPTPMPIKHPEHPVVNWSQLLAARQHDPLTRSAVYDPHWPQPFKVQIPPQAADPQVAANAEAHISALLTPTEVGLVLESIVYGKSKRAAMINGRIYREGSEVAVAVGQGGTVAFQLATIKRASVGLERYGKTFWLEFPRPKLVLSNREERGGNRPRQLPHDQP